MKNNSIKIEADKVTRAFSKQLKEALMQKNMTQSELARLTGLTEVTIHRYVTGQREPSLTNLIRVLMALGYNEIDWDITVIKE